jgi:hypothetical protein
MPDADKLENTKMLYVNSKITANPGDKEDVLVASIPLEGVTVPNLAVFENVSEMKVALRHVDLNGVFAAAGSAPSKELEFKWAYQDKDPGTRVKKGTTVKVGIWQKAKDGAPKPQPTVQRWILETVTVSPTTPDKGWSYSGQQSSSARLTIYNGDKADLQWTPPPQQIDSNGFTVALSARGTPADPKGRLAALIGISVVGLDADLPSKEWSAYAVAESGPSSASKSVTFKPSASANEVEVKIGLMWGSLGFTYKYRKAS